MGLCPKFLIYEKLGGGLFWGNLKKNSKNIHNYLILTDVSDILTVCVLRRHTAYRCCWRLFSTMLEIMKGNKYDLQ